MYFLPQIMKLECGPLNSYKLYNEEEKFLPGGLWSLFIDIFAKDYEFPLQLYKLDVCAVFLTSVSLSEHETMLFMVL